MGLSDAFSGIIEKIIKVLPLSPFAQYIDRFAALPYLSYLNWFVPISEMLAVGLSWLSAITIFYLISVIMRWVKLIGD